MRRLLVVLMAALLASVVFVGCGGGDDDEASDDGVEAASSEDSGDDGNDDSDDGDSGSGIGNVLSATDCTRAVQAMSAAVSSVSLAMSGGGEELEESVKQMEEFADDAPSDIRDELRTLSDAYTTYGETLRDSGWNPSSGKPPSEEVIAKLEEASKALETEEVTAAQEAVDKWFADECGQ